MKAIPRAVLSFNVDEGVDIAVIRKPPQQTFLTPGQMKCQCGRNARLPQVKVVVRVWQDECQGVIEDINGHPLDIVEVPQPGLTFRLLHAYCRHERLIPLATELHLSKMPLRRKKLARRAHQWFLAKFRRWLRNAA